MKIHDTFNLGSAENVGSKGSSMVMGLLVDVYMLVFGMLKIYNYDFYTFSIRMIISE